MNPVETWIAYEYQVKGRDPNDLAEELDVHRTRIPRLLTEMGVGTPEMLMRENPGLLVQEHGSVAKAARDTGISCSKLMRSYELHG